MYEDVGLQVPDDRTDLTDIGRRDNAMERLFFFINETGEYFLSNEEELCRAYCREHGYTYRAVYYDLGY